MTSSYSEFHSHSDVNIIQPFENDLKSLSIPDEIKHLVVKLALSCPKETHRMGVRRQQLFSYIYLAYLQLGYNFDPDLVINELKMSKREINMALRIISGTSSSEISLPAGEQEGEVISAPIVVISPMIYIEEICKNNNLLEQLSKLEKIVNDIYDPFYDNYHYHKLLYKDDEVVAEKCHCKDIKTVGIKPLDKAMEILNEELNRRFNQVSVTSTSHSQELF
jgi:hypothetical protein